MSDKQDDSKDLEIIKNIQNRIDKIEQIKKSQTGFRNIALIVILALIGLLFMRLNNIANELKNNQEAIVETLQKDAEELLKQRLTGLKAKAQKELLPSLSESVKKEYAKNSEKLEGHIKSLETDLRKVTEERIYKLLENALNVAFDNIGETYSEAEIKELEENIETIAIKITENVMASSADSIIKLEPEFDAIADRLTSISVDVVNIEKIDPDLAERKLVAALLDLLKYQIVPEDAVEPAVQ
ncbi:hypothetical protein LNTAR_01572 [Lentisphaera araneosa HTCC2155]|jgi:hypothetical protein|uniref:Uncharacterized protein n=1 Tax=Lentisphaera araneosa HTCC2155 TaxID=313628 RepID=A6DRA8_9BACT|nr:hypothetical protein [Lentisphaera araneosa]EDM25855.1 hypothetical protein LNTAR_01572 [Lentisphaera araneosa HTCC2155]